MKSSSFLFIFLLVQAAKGQTYLVKNVTIIPMNREIVLENRDVLVRDGLIRSVSPAGQSAGSTATVIDATGKFLVPGLFDMHVHFFYEQGKHVNTCEAELNMMLANGVTTARILAGHPAYLEARSHTRKGTWAGPELFVASPQLVGRWPWSPEFKNFEITDTREKAMQAVRKFKQEGYDAIKITFMMKRDVYDAIIETAKEVNIKVTGHVGPQVKLPAALAAGQQIEHMDEFIDVLLPDTSYNHGQSVSDMNIWRKNAWATVPFLDESRIPDLVKKVKQAGIYVTPTNYFFISTFGEGTSEEQAKSSPGYTFIPETLKEERWKNWHHYNNLSFPPESREKYTALRKKMALELWKAGVPLMAGSDSPEFFLVQGFALHDELEMFVKTGLSPFAALQTATVNPARYLGSLSRTGTVEVGKEADLLLLDKNPLEDIRHTRSIAGVMLNGQWYGRDVLSGMLEKARLTIQKQ